MGLLSGMFGSKASPAEAAAQSRMTAMTGAAQSNQAAQDGTLSQYEGDLTQSPMYKRMVTMGTQDTTAAYNQARMKRSTAARTAGFGYTSPVAQNDGATVDQAEAGDIGRVGTDAMEKLMPYQMQAAGMRGSNVATYTGAGTQAMDQWGKMETQRKQAQGSMWGKIAGLGMMGASMIPGLGAGAKVLQSAGGGMMR